MVDVCLGDADALIFNADEAVPVIYQQINGDNGV
jgi:hypothetical protein